MNILKYIVVLVLSVLLSLMMWIFSKNFLTGLLSGTVLFSAFVLWNFFRSSNEGVQTTEDIETVQPTQTTTVNPTAQTPSSGVVNNPPVN